LPGGSNFIDQVKVQFSDNQFIIVFTSLDNSLSSGVNKVGGAVEFTQIPRLFSTNSVNTAHEVAISDGMSGLFDLPQILTQSGDGGRGIVDNFGTVQAQASGTIREVTIVADVDTDLGVSGLENGVAEVSWLEEELFPETSGVGNVVLSVLAEVFTISVNDGGSVIENTSHVLFVDGSDDNHLVFLGIFRQKVGGGAGDGFSRGIPGLVLAGAEVRSVEDLLEAENLDSLLAGFVDQRKMLLEHGVLDLIDGAFTFSHGQAHLDEAGLDNSRLLGRDERLHVGAERCL
jgi:hypothetical protein